MNKRGQGAIKLIYYGIVALMIGAIVIFAFASTVPRMLKNIEEKVAAKDIGLTIMTLSASPNDIVYRYDKNTEDYEVQITDNEVSVSSSQGTGRYRYMEMVGVVSDNALIQNALVIPLTLSNKRLSFQDMTVSYNDECSIIRSQYPKEKIKVRIIARSDIAQEKLEQIGTFMKMHSTDANSRIEFVEYDEDLLLMLETGNEAGIWYYEDQNFPEPHYRKIACYINKEISEEENINVLAAPFNMKASSEKEIRFVLPDNAQLREEINKDAHLSAIISRDLYSAIMLGISY